MPGILGASRQQVLLCGPMCKEPEWNASRNIYTNKVLQRRSDISWCFKKQHEAVKQITAWRCVCREMALISKWNAVHNQETCISSSRFHDFDIICCTARSQSIVHFGLFCNLIDVSRSAWLLIKQFLRLAHRHVVFRMSFGWRTSSSGLAVKRCNERWGWKIRKGSRSICFWQTFDL